LGRKGLDLPENRDQWWLPVNVVMNHQIPQNVKNSLTVIDAFWD
jgi:hypothetical protein